MRDDATYEAARRETRPASFALRETAGLVFIHGGQRKSD